jgi:hypothetical protein
VLIVLVSPRTIGWRSSTTIVRQNGAEHLLKVQLIDSDNLVMTLSGGRSAITILPANCPRRV